MNKVDWSFAPEGATHFLPALSQAHCDVWFKIVDGYAVSAGYDRLNGWAHSYTKDCQPSTDMTRLISRKDDETKPWSGQEDGLPPVGTVCEHSADSNEGDNQDGEWFKVEVIAHHRFQEDDYVCAVWVRDYEISYSSAGYHFRSLKAPEQIATEKRETAIRELMDIAGVDCRVTAARLVDAGFKREVV